MTSSYVMKVSGNGQVSIPAEVRSRGHADRLLVVDLGDRVVMRPLPQDPIGELEGAYRDRGPTTRQARQMSREDDLAAEAKRRG